MQRQSSEWNPIQKIGFFASSENITQSIFVIIDMMPSFIAARKPSIISSLGESLRNAMNEGQYILIVNYDRGGQRFIDNKWVTVPIEERVDDQLHPDLKKILEAYPNKATIWKKTDSGANEILGHLKSKNIPFSRICVAGVNICGCVSSTVEDLSRNQGNFIIELNESCCTCDCSSSEGICTRYSISNLEDYKGVINISKIKQNLLLAALSGANHLDVQNILAEYGTKICQHENIKELEKLKEIKRDLLASLRLIKLGKCNNMQSSLNLEASINQLLDSIQYHFDTRNSEKCVMM